jgi:hypothetical protein
MSIRVDFRITPCQWISEDITFMLLLYLGVRIPDHAEKNRADKGLNSGLTRTTDMEVHQLKEGATQLACPSSQGVISEVDYTIFAIALMSKCRNNVPAHESGEQTFEAVQGGCQ